MTCIEWRAGAARHLAAAWVINSLLAGCGSSAPVHYYRIDAVEPRAAVPADDTVVLAIGRMSFPDYLRQPYMVRRGQGAEMLVDEQSRWAEPLEQAVPRIVASNVEALVPGVVAVPAYDAPVRWDCRLFATVYRLDTDPAGHTELVVQWGIAGAEGETWVVPGTSRYRSQATPVDDSNAMAAAVGEVLTQLGRYEIVETLGFSRDVAARLQISTEGGPRADHSANDGR